MDCEVCANNKTDYCLICKDDDMFMTQEQKEECDMMCDLMCGGVEE